VVRLDLADNNTENLAPQDTAGTTQKAVERAWQIESPVVELAKAAEYLRGHGSGLAAKPAAALNAESASKRLAEAVAAARSEGREVVAISTAAKDGAVTIAKGVSVEARSSAKEACAFIEEKLKAGAQPSVLMLLDPPVYNEAKPREITPTQQPKTVDAEAKPEQPETRMTMPGSSTTVIVNTPRDGKPEIAVKLPEGARRIGEPVLFSNNSARLSGCASESIAAIAEAIKRSGFKRVILIASADASGSEKGNSELARHRGEVVTAAFLKAGVAVESVLSVGDSFAPEGAPASERKNFRAVCAYTVDAVTAASAASPW
jgi:outer membrane protein OmpA-like peptidoglycan-associated protein